ncbi:MAG: SDR family oxidoreductase [Acidimicrobiia bacterium]|nr:SDR family oxidoreductase [Acidimicrobiia bacterium]
MSSPAPIAIVTGASSGIGKAIATHLAAAGFRVFGSRLPDEPDAAIADQALIPLDVDDESSVEAFVDDVTAQAGRIDVLVNCAGFGIAGPLEETTVDEAKAQFETNYFGVHRMCRAVLPMMRRQGSGRVVTVSSIGGLIALPFQATYSATKFALEGLMEALRHEVRPFGIAVSLIEPADFATGFTAKRRIAREAGSSDSPYADAFVTALEVVTKDEIGGWEPDAIGELAVKIVTRRRPRLRYTVGRLDERFASWLKRVVPNRWFEPIVGHHYQP